MIHISKDNNNKKQLLQLSLSEEFAIVSFVILFIGMIVVAWWLDKEIKQAVFQQTVQTTKLFADSFYSKLVKELGTQDQLNPDSLYIIDSLSHNSPIGKQFAFINIWSKSGKLAYSSNPDIDSGKIPLKTNDIRKGNDQVNWELYTPEKLKSHLGVDFDSELLEIILPIHESNSDYIIAVAELYFYTDQLRNTILKSQLRSLLLLSAVTLITMILLYSIVRRANKTIWNQQGKLEHQIGQLSDLLDSNQKLHLKVLNATYKTTEVSEQLLRRISAELHDAPAQCLSYALLRMDSIYSKIKSCDEHSIFKNQLIAELKAVQEATADALQDIRNLSTHLSMPVLENLGLTEVINKVINNHQRRTSTMVTTKFTGLLNTPLPMALMIGIYRFVQEALNNAYRHGKGMNQHVRLKITDKKVIIEVSDQGPGFNEKSDPMGNCLGLIGLRERIESLRGTFEIHSVINKGTTLKASIPYTLTSELHEKQN